ncbi:hypothetical protein ARMA_2366 [Ardenticatena maritima]|uniref:Methylhydantoinase n=1 Tax=Ardenticatena maritima TaxID=872965 RepID=A0A0M8K8F4_9CHLR|nr:hydantoinase/oxoprolinase family protein [Ardenticatena maritima]KPL89295.1 hypothetical protein SE16_02140 [Ardenticatena maritima]GAP63943.1 hypothetical protein ARMA_2366 [Ardenticatena maritima]
MTRVRIGIDVGGTFTKAVAVDAHTLHLLGQALVPTTHHAPEGVAAGVVAVLRRLLERHAIVPEDVALVAHSTTQAVNALLEGDTATVGILGMGRGRDVLEAAKRTHIGDITLAPEHTLQTRHLFVETTHGLTRETARQAIQQLQAQGAEAIVASEAFSVEDPTHENLVLDVAAEMGVPAVAAHQMTGAYGLEVRTVTAAINAALLPKMLETARHVEQGLRQYGIHAPLMLMRGDGGLADLATMRQRPILTLFSGPAASLAGALLAGRVVFGVFLEIGGTSSNISLIRHGMPTMHYVKVMSHPTCVQALDVRVQGVAGGSMIRSGARGLVDVGPRSAHIAGLPYACFDPAVLDAAHLRLETCSPTPDDPDDYVVLADEQGRRWALTLTCAANALGWVPRGAYAEGHRDAALRAFHLLGAMWGMSAEEAAQAVLNQATARIAEAIRQMTREYKVPHDRLLLIGGGGGAGALVPPVAQALGITYTLPRHAEVISSLGDALAWVREVVEQPMRGHDNGHDLVREARAAAIRSGAAPHTVSVVVERDEQRGMLRAIATGQAALATPTHDLRMTPEEAQRLAAEACGMPPNRLELLATNDVFHVFRVPRHWWRAPRLAVVDVRGGVRFFSGKAHVVFGTPPHLLERMQHLLGASPAHFMPDVRLLIDGQLIDLTAVGEPTTSLLETIRTIVEPLDNKRVIAIVGG